MNLDQLRYIVSLRETKSITQTASSFFISHQAISKSLKALENELGVVLFTRSNQGIDFTQAGIQLYDFAENTLHSYENLEVNLNAFKTMHSSANIPGKLAIYSIPRYFTTSFWDFMKYFQAKNPSLDITVTNLQADRIINEVEFNENVLAFITADKLRNNLKNALNARKISFTIIKEQELFACVYKKYLSSKSDIFTYDDSAKYPQIAFRYPYQLIESSVCNPKYTVDSFEQQKNILKSFPCHALYTKEEWECFFSRSFSLLPLDVKRSLLFICLHNASPS